MEHIFSGISNNRKIRLVIADDERHLVAKDLLRYVPLARSINNQILSNESADDFINSLKPITKNKSIADLADITLQLGESYWTLDKSVTFQPMWSELYAKITSDDFYLNKIILQDSLEKDLRYWMILSLFYTSVFLSKEGINKIELNKICYHGKHDRTFNQQLSQFKKKNPLFIHAFYPSSNMDIDTKNILDLEIISKIISSILASKNSFILSKDIPKTMPNNPLKIFTDITLTPKVPSAFLNDLLSYKEKTFLKDYTSEIFTAYNHYLLERLSCMNYMLCLSSVLAGCTENRYIYGSPGVLCTKTLLSLAASPLLNFRLTFLRCFRESHTKIVLRDNYSFALCAKSFINYHLGCTIPILDLLIHFVVGISLNSSSISKFDLNDYLANKRKNYFHSLLNTEKGRKDIYLFSSSFDNRLKKNIPRAKENIEIFYNMDSDHSLQYNLYMIFYDEILNMAKINLFDNDAIKMAIEQEQASALQMSLQKYMQGASVPPDFQLRSDEVLKNELLEKGKKRSQ